MNLVPVASSNLRAIGYDTNTKTLQVAFCNNSLYEYYAVPDSIHSGLMEAKSHGSYFDTHIKNAAYPYRYRKTR